MTPLRLLEKWRLPMDSKSLCKNTGKNKLISIGQQRESIHAILVLFKGKLFKMNNIILNFFSIRNLVTGNYNFKSIFWSVLGNFLNYMLDVESVIFFELYFRFWKYCPKDGSKCITWCLEFVLKHFGSVISWHFILIVNLC